MANISPVQVWYQGEQKQANIFTLISNYDNLEDSATFQYQLIESIIILGEQYSNVLLIGQLPINGQEYDDWDTSVSANEWIYNWAADKLGLTIINL